MPVRWITSLLPVLLAAGLAAAPADAGPVTARAPGSSLDATPRTVGAAEPVRPVRRSYENPLAPRVAGGRTVDSCADPAVLRAQGRWFMYCTSDPLDDADVDDEGNLVLHPLPMLVSRDLVSWRYAGDALPEPPAWAADGALLWAPDIVHSRATGRFYLTFTVTDTDDAVSGEPDCDSDSAIGVAVSDSPLGPWEVADEPLVAPRRNADGPGTGCDFYWTYDPDVLGDHVGRTGVLYFGSYFGGLWADRVRFTRDGIRTTGTARQVAIGNRYEGSNVVRRNGWYYLFGSATNCCNGPLTGYSVFAGRSRSPFGPFVDRDGNRLLDVRVGGTPVLSMNGNRWVGAGHTSSFRDAGGRWWTAYHAVDRRDPYFETDPGFTKRPALLDPLDWVDGWPTVRAGRWASDRRMPAPAARPGERSRYRPDPVPSQRPGAVLQQEGFESPTLPDGWTWVREPDAGGWAVGDGSLVMETAAGDLHEDSNDAPVLTTALPDGDVVVQTRVKLDVPADGCCQNFVQAGLVLYGGDDRFLKLTHASLWETRQTEFAKEVPSAPAEHPRYGNTVVGAPGTWTGLRIVREGASYTAYTRSGRQPWVRGGTWSHHLGAAPRIGLVAMGGTGFTAEFDAVSTRRLR
jgi:arabinan endo-1,5-alpha-L-arabinosidase